MASVNRVLLLGVLDKDPELRFTPDGTANCMLTVLTVIAQESHRHKVHCQERLGEMAGDHLRKGDVVYVEGRLHMHRWQDRRGDEHRRLEVLASNVLALQSAPAESSGTGA